MGLSRKKLKRLKLKCAAYETESVWVSFVSFTYGRGYLNLEPLKSSLGGLVSRNS